MENCLEGLEAHVSEEMNANLLREFAMAEIEIALSQMHMLKSLGPDGFSPSFYQRSWATRRTKVCKVMLDFLNNGIFDTFKLSPIKERSRTTYVYYI